MSSLRTFFKGLESIEKSIFAFLCVLAHVFPTQKLAAQNTGDYRVDKTEPYELVAPTLTTLHTNLVFSKEDQLQKTGYTFNKSDSSVVIVGELITTDTLLKYIKNDILTQLNVTKLDTSKQYLDNNPTLTKNLSIHCDSFVLDSSLWFPGVNVLIHARVINWGKDKILKTTPRPRRESQKATQAKKGANAGNIHIICSIIRGGREQSSRSTLPPITLEAEGGDGQVVQFGEIIYNPFTPIKDIWVYKDDKISNKQESNCYWNQNIAQMGTNIIAIDHSPGTFTSLGSWLTPSKTEQRTGGTTGTYNPNLGTSVVKAQYNGYSGLFYYGGKYWDGSADTRLNWENCKVRKPGEGGNGGRITVNIPRDRVPYEFIAKNARGRRGPYYVPAQKMSDVSLDYEATGGIITKIKGIKAPKYEILSAKIDIEERGGLVCNKAILTKVSAATFTILDLTTVEGQNAAWSFVKAYENYAIEPKPVYSTNYLSTDAFVKPSEIYLRHKLTLEKNKIKDFQSLPPSDTAAVLKNLRAIAQGIDELIKVTKQEVETSSDQTARNYYSFKLIEARKLQAELDMVAQNVVDQRYLDEFNNPLGYRPVLSFTSINDFIKNNLDSDLELYIQANEAMKNINDRKKFLESIPALITKLDKAINTGYADLQKNESTIDSLGLVGLNLEKIAQALDDSLKSLEKKLLEKAKKESEEEKLVRALAKTAAVGAACFATAAGGPTAGAFAYALVDKLGNAGVNAQYDNKDYTPVEMARRDVNVMPFFGGLERHNLEPVQKELKTLEYRVNNKLFEKFDSWEVKKDTSNFLTVKFPKSLQEYRDRKEELEKDAEEIRTNRERTNAMASFAVKGGEEIYSTFTRTDILDNAINRVINQSVEYREIGERIKYNAGKYGEFGMALRAAIMEKGAITSRIVELSEQRQQLRIIQQDPEAFYDPLLANNMASIETEALRRLKWMEYQLINVYNYTTLTPYPSDSITNFRLLASKELDKNTDAKFKRMRTAYKGHLQYMKFLMVSAASTTHKRDDLNGKTVIFNENGSPEILAALNNEKIYTLDLYNDLTNIVQADKENIRIITLDLEEFELSRKLNDNEELELTIELDDEGILRKGDKLYRFKDDAIAIETWQWTLSVPKAGNSGQAQKEAIIPSDIYKSMLDGLINEGGTKERGPSNLFTLKPAWSKMTIKLAKKLTKNSPPIEIKRLKFKVIRDFETIPSNSKFKVCDLRVKAEETDVRLVVKKGTNPADTLSNSQYNIVATNTSFQLEAYSIDTNRVFDRWETTPSMTANGNKLQFNVKDLNVFVRPVFKNKGQSPILKSGPLLANGKAKSVKLHGSPKAGEQPVFSVPLDFFNQNLKPTATETNGFYRVVYEHEEYFVNKKDLK